MLIPVKCVRPNCNFNNLVVVRKFTVIILGFIFVVSPVKVVSLYQCMRKPVREFELSNETWGTAKSIPCRITSVKQCAAAPTVLLLYTQDRSQLDRKLNIKLQSASAYLLLMM